MTSFSGMALSNIVMPIRMLREICALRAAAAGTFDAGRLGRIDRARLHGLLSDPAAAEAFEADRHLFAKVLGQREIPGGVNVGDRRALHALMFGLAPRRVLEIGTHVGASTVHMARALMQRHAAHFVTVDIVDSNAPEGPWTRAGLPWAPREMLRELGCNSLVEFVIADSLDYLARDGVDYDFIFLDGWHSSGRVYREIQLALRRLASGGAILLHDFYPEGRSLYAGVPPVLGPYLAAARIVRECDAIQVLPLGNLPWPTKLGSNVTSLALVTKAQGINGS